MFGRWIRFAIRRHWNPESSLPIILQKSKKTESHVVVMIVVVDYESADDEAVAWISEPEPTVEIAVEKAVDVVVDVIVAVAVAKVSIYVWTLQKCVYIATLFVPLADDLDLDVVDEVHS